MASINLWETCYSAKVEEEEEEEEGSPVKEPSLKILFIESFAERCPTTRDLLHSPIKVPG
jgi:hypothetical protein